MLEDRLPGPIRLINFHRYLCVWFAADPSLKPNPPRRLSHTLGRRVLVFRKVIRYKAVFKVDKGLYCAVAAQNLKLDRHEYGHLLNTRVFRRVISWLPTSD